MKLHEYTEPVQGILNIVVISQQLNLLLITPFSELHQTDMVVTILTTILTFAIV